MTDEKENRSESSLLQELRERAKELACLYSIEELLSRTGRNIDEVLNEVVGVIPKGWQYPEICHASIFLESSVYSTSGFDTCVARHYAEIMIQDEAAGRVEVGYSKDMPPADHGPFLQEEMKLIKTIADRIGHFLLHKKLRNMFDNNGLSAATRAREWEVALDMLKKTEPQLYERISRRMLNHLCWLGVGEAGELLQRFVDLKREDVTGEINKPVQRTNMKGPHQPLEEIFELAAANLNNKEILSLIQKWIHEDRASSLVGPMLNLHTSWKDLNDAVRRFKHHSSDGIDLSLSTVNGVKVGLIKRFFSDDPGFVHIAKKYVELDDFFDAMERVIYPSAAYGRLGGKGAGIFLGSLVLERSRDRFPEIGEIKTPKTWYVTSDGLIDFLNHNNLEEAYERRYQNAEKIRQDYPHLVQVFKSSSFSQDMVRGLSMALDDLGDVPIIVRSSSLLEDRLGSAFSGKYKSLFLANQGRKKDRLDALLDAVAEVYASTFSPDPIEYRSKKGLLDFDEEMGVLIQEVVGKKVGKYFFPSFAGVALTYNEFRWSPRIDREDGLLRLVPGLGTRAVDRTEDYPVLVAPGKPNLRANVTVDEIMRYSPAKIDVINLEENTFETIDFDVFIKEVGSDYPAVSKIVSIVADGMVRHPMGISADYSKDRTVVTFQGMTSRGGFIEQVKAILKSLYEAIGTPVDVEFAHDGESFYLLQCRPQSHASGGVPVVIPESVPDRDILFTARKYVSNGMVPNITHIVYVDGEGYSELSERTDLLAVGQAVGMLNRQLPKKQFILIGPGRWGSRGDIKLGVKVTYADINHCAMLIEVARKKGNYLPDLSFGTHFFQDLLEASIRYLPLYPDDDDVVFNESFFREAPSILEEMLPEYGYLGNTLRVIDVQNVTDGKVARVLMNANEDRAVALLADPAASIDTAVEFAEDHWIGNKDHWRWRLRMAERIASQILPGQYGVKAVYVIGSSKNATAGPGSDIDLLIHDENNKEARAKLQLWLEGWSACLAEINYLRTGYRAEGLLDIHFITDSDIQNRTSFAVKIDAVTDAARKLPLRGE